MKRSSSFEGGVHLGRGAVSDNHGKKILWGNSLGKFPVNYLNMLCDMKQEMLHILTIAVGKIMQACVRNLKY